MDIDHEHDPQPDHKRDLKIFVGMLCGIGLILLISHFRLGWIGTTLIAGLAAVQAVVVAFYFMHLISKKKTVHLVLLLTIIVLISLLFLPAWDIGDSIRSHSPYTVY